jgi:hypothetical protein
MAIEVWLKARFKKTELGYGHSGNFPTMVGRREERYGHDDYCMEDGGDVRFYHVKG